MVFNDTFDGERVDVRWEFGDERGSFSVDVPLGGRALREIEFTPRAPGRARLVIVAEKDGREVFREEEQWFEVS